MISKKNAKCCHGYSNFGMLRAGECCDTVTLTVISGKQCASTRWCGGGDGGRDSDACKSAARIPKNRKCDQARLGHPSHQAHAHELRRQRLGGGGGDDDEGAADEQGEEEGNFLGAYSNNFAGACSHCSADNLCGAANGNTVCPGGYLCSDEGTCEKYTSSASDSEDESSSSSSKLPPQLTDVSHPMFRFSNNYGLQCVKPDCARDGQCGPDHGNRVCPGGHTCMPTGHCKESKEAARLGAGSTPSEALLAAFSDNHLGACPARVCALDQRCGPDNGFQVCMSGQTCVKGRCVMNYVFETKRFMKSDILADYSDNARGACHRCAGGHRKICGGDKRLVCPGNMVCAIRPDPDQPKKSAFNNNNNNATSDDDDDDDADEFEDLDDDGRMEAPGGSEEAYERSVDGNARGPHEKTFKTGDGGSGVGYDSFETFQKKASEKIEGATYGKPVCLTPEEVEEMDIPDEDIYPFSDDEEGEGVRDEDDDIERDKSECSRPDLISLPIIVNRKVDNATWAEVPPQLSDEELYVESSETASGELAGDGGDANAPAEKKLTRKYVVKCATSKPGRSSEGMPCGIRGTHVELVCPTWATCVDADVAVSTVSATLGADEDKKKNTDLFAGYNPRPKYACVSLTDGDGSKRRSFMDHEVYDFPNDDDPWLASRVCETSAVVDGAFVIRSAELPDLPPPVTRADLGASSTVTYLHVQEPCGPHHGGLICSSEDMVCAAREGICISVALARAAQYVIIPEFSHNSGATAPAAVAAAVAAERAEALATAWVRSDHSPQHC